MKKILLILTICLVCSISVFSQSKKKWENTQTLNSISVYEDFLKKYPDGKYTELAKQGLEQLVFLNAKQQNTEKAYEDYLKKYPDGKNSEFAKQSLEQLEFSNVKQQNTVKAYEDFLLKHGQSTFATEASTKLRSLRFDVLNSHPTIAGCEEFLHFYSSGSDVDTANKLLDQLSFKESEKLNSEKSYESYLSKFPNGQSTSIAISNLQEIRFINARKIKTVEAYENFLKLYPEGTSAEQLRKELNGLRKFEESRKLGEVALRMAPKGAISFSASPFGGSMQATGTQTNFPSTLQEDMETFRKMINDGVDPNLIRIKGFEPAGSKDIGNGLAIFSSGNPGNVVSADEGGMSLLEYFTAIKLEDARKILQLKKQK